MWTGRSNDHHRRRAAGSIDTISNSNSYRGDEIRHRDCTGQRSGRDREHVSRVVMTVTIPRMATATPTSLTSTPAARGLILEQRNGGGRVCAGWWFGVVAMSALTLVNRGNALMCGWKGRIGRWQWGIDRYRYDVVCGGSRGAGRIKVLPRSVSVRGVASG